MASGRNFFYRIQLTHPVWAEDGGTYDGGDHDDGNGHHQTDHGHSHNHFMRGIGGYYNPGLWGSYVSGLRRPYVDCSCGYAGLFTDFIILTCPLLQSLRNHLHIQRQEAKLAQPRTAYWYYCQKPEGYYLHAKDARTTDRSLHLNLTHNDEARTP